MNNHSLLNNISSDLSKLSLETILELAANADSKLAILAHNRLKYLRQVNPQELSRIITALKYASEAALLAAGDWLFHSDGEKNFSLYQDLVLHVNQLINLVKARPGEPPGDWCQEGLAALLALKGDYHLKQLLILAQRYSWAKKIVAWLPSNLRLSDGQKVTLVLAKLQLKQREIKRARKLAIAKDWQALAKLSQAELIIAREKINKELSPIRIITRPTSLPIYPELALTWPGGNLALLEKIIYITAQEGTQAYIAARKTAQITNRIVILMGNATLGGPPLWAVPGPWEQGWANLRPITSPPIKICTRLAQLRTRRLIGPALLRSLWDLRWALAIHKRSWQKLYNMLKKASCWLEPKEKQQILDGCLSLSQGEYHWSQAELQAQFTLNQALSMEITTKKSLSLIWGLANAAQKQQIRKNRFCVPLILPWIDKFIASTNRNSEHVYLAELTSLFVKLDFSPLLILIDESNHPSSPSLNHILNTANYYRPNLSFKGVGCFAGQPEPKDLVDALVEASQNTNLVAIRPLPSLTLGAGLNEFLNGRNIDKPLTPASRDGADWLIQGTALAPLAIQNRYSFREEPASWLLTKSGFLNLGSWVRTRIRTLTARRDPSPGIKNDFWRNYIIACELW